MKIENIKVFSSSSYEDLLSKVILATINKRFLVRPLIVPPTSFAIRKNDRYSTRFWKYNGEDRYDIAIEFIKVEREG